MNISISEEYHQNSNRFISTQQLIPKTICYFPKRRQTWKKPNQWNMIRRKQNYWDALIKWTKKIPYFTEFEFISKTIFFNSFKFSNFIIKSILYSSNLNINLLFFQTKTLFRCLQFSSYIYCLFVNIVDHTQNIILVALKIIDHHIVIWMFSKAFSATKLLVRVHP